MESIITPLPDGRFIAYVGTLYVADGAHCLHVYKEYKARFFKTKGGAIRSTSKFIRLNSELLNLFQKEREEVRLAK